MLESDVEMALRAQRALRGFSTMAASVPLASFVAEVKGVKFYDCRGLRACRGESVVGSRTTRTMSTAWRCDYSEGDDSWDT